MAGSGTAHLRPDQHPLLTARNLTVEYPAPDGTAVHAVSDVSIDVLPGESLGLVGESGCGKSTFGRSLMLLQHLNAGEITFDHRQLTGLRPRALRDARRGMQMVFQDPVSSLNPRRTVRALVAEGLSITGAPKPWDRAVEAALTAVGLDPEAIGHRRAGELSGGQCQRVAIARALLLEPRLLLCDEPVSALDVSIQAQILNVLEDLRADRGLALIFIAHDLAVVKSISDRVAVMYLGKLCEVAPAHELYTGPAHPYTRALLDSVPDPDVFNVDTRPRISGELPSPTEPPSGCRFRTRCPLASARCATEEPILREHRAGHYVACHLAN